jgi:hypothetical protein
MRGGDFDEAVAALRGWVGEHVVVRLDPDEAVMEGRLHEFVSPGIDGAAFALSDEATGMPPTGVAVALFRDAARLVDAAPDMLVVEQGRVRITVRRQAPGNV